MKRVISIILCTLVVFMPFTASLAAQAKYANTISFLTEMDKINVDYTVKGIDDSDKMEHITIGNKGENTSYTIHYFFDEINSEVGIRVWDIITFSDSDLNRVIRVVNNLNYQYKYCKWYVDETDNTVTLSWDLILRENKDVGDIVREATLHLVQILDKGYESLGIYNK